VQRYDAHTYVLRQSKALSAEAQFKDKPGAHTFDDFVIMTGPYRSYIVNLRACALWAKIRPPA
jgi:hypothetical protein